MKLVLILAMSIPLISCVGQRGFPPEHQIVNFDHMSAQLYRGAQPNRHGLEYLATQGVKTVVNLRQPQDAFPDEETTARALGMEYHGGLTECHKVPVPKTAATARAVRGLDSLTRRQ